MNIWNSNINKYSIRQKKILIKKNILTHWIIFLFAFLCSICSYPNEDGLVNRAKADIRVWASAIEMVVADYGKYPQFQNIEALASYLKAGSYWFEPVINDPWNHAYQYKCYENNYKLWSNGPDGKAGTPDDIEIVKKYTGGGAA